MTFLKRACGGFVIATILVQVATMAWADNYVTGMLYVTDYGLENLDRYMYTFDTTIDQITAIAPDGFGNNPTNAVLITGDVKEGVQGTANDLILVDGTHGALTSISRYTLNGQLIGTIPVNFSNYNAGQPGIGNIVVTPDGKYLYAPLEEGNAIVKISLATGAIVSSTPFTAAHDIAIASYNTTTGAAVLYATGYSGPSPSVAVITDNGANSASSLTQTQTLVTNATLTNNGLTSQRPTGLFVASDGSLYVNMNNSSEAGPDGVQHYSISSIGGTLTATYDPLTSIVSDSALHFIFGESIGPDGNVYIAALGGGNGVFGGNTGYTDGVFQYTVPTGGAQATLADITQYIQGETEGTNTGYEGLSAPKYLQFGINFAPAPDIGYNGTPEPGNVVLFLAVAMVAGFVFHRKSRSHPQSGFSAP